MYCHSMIKIISLLPATVSEVSKKLNIDSKKIEEILIDLFKRGLVIIEDRINNKDVYGIPEDFGMFLDLILFDRGYTKMGRGFRDKIQEFFNDWKNVLGLYVNCSFLHVPI